MSYKSVDRALNLLRYLPRVSISNIRDNPGSRKVSNLEEDCGFYLFIFLFPRLNIGAEDNMEAINMERGIKVPDKDKTT